MNRSSVTEAESLFREQDAIRARTGLLSDVQKSAKGDDLALFAAICDALRDPAIPAAIKVAAGRAMLTAARTVDSQRLTDITARLATLGVTSV
jgi:hypothetical protein